MKKIISIISALALCVTLTACNKTETPNDFSSIEVVKWGEGDRPVYYQLDDLEKASELVVVGTLLDDAEQVVDTAYSEFFEKDIIKWVSSYGTVEVTKVIKGDVSVGDTIKVGQLYGLVDNRLITMSALTPLVKGDTWLFFLSTSGDCGYYWCTGDSDGRYPVSTVQNQALAVSEYSQLGVYNREDFKDEIYSEIVEKYGI